MSATHDAQAAARLDAIDALRGLAVVFMIALHTSHGWLALDLRQGAAWNVIRSLGGLAAPLFLLLAGASLGLAWHAGSLSPAARRDAGIARGFRIVLLGYALRVQMWMLDASGYRDPRAWAIAGVLLAGYFLLDRGVARWRAGRSAIAPRFLAGFGAIAIGATALSRWYPDRVVGVFRVDVLQAIGVSIALVSIAAATLDARRLRFAAIGLFVAVATPWIESGALNVLPPALAGYLARQTLAPGTIAPGLFPLFPWAAYAFLGAALGLDWARAAQAGTFSRRVVAAGAAGALIALTSCELFPFARGLLTAQPWLTHPVRIGYRVGLALVFAAVCVALVRSRAARWPLVTFGQASLLVYWVHLEFAFGLASRPLARQLDFSQWFTWTLVLVLAMLALASVSSWALGALQPRALARVPADASTSAPRAGLRAL